MGSTLLDALKRMATQIRCESSVSNGSAFGCDRFRCGKLDGHSGKHQSIYSACVHGGESVDVTVEWE